MKLNRDLENRLTEWAREYGGGKYEDIGSVKSWLGSMVKWGGRAPTGLGVIPLGTGADEVQEAVQALGELEDGFVPSCVIRCEYLTPGQPMQMKLDRLRSIGVGFGRTSYYERLRFARQFVAERIKVPYEAEDDEIEVA